MPKLIFMMIMVFSFSAGAYQQGSCDGASGLISAELPQPTHSSICFYGSSSDDVIGFKTTKRQGASYRVVDVILSLNNEKHSFTLYDTGPRPFWTTPEIKWGRAIFYYDRIYIFGFDGRDKIDASSFGLTTDQRTHFEGPFEIVIVTDDGDDAVSLSTVYRTRTQKGI